MSRPAIAVENLSKAYRIGLKEEVPDTLMSAMTGFMKAPLKKFHELRKLDTFRHSGDSDDIYWALKDVSFEVQEGEVLGVIGRNGAGKSTLLKILSRITEPTSGRAVIRGRVSSLLEVGTGFHPELSGRENVYLNGTILGMTKREIDRKFDEIVDFSGVEKFLDTPIKRYSSGMKVRLAFAVAAHLEPEILIIDEVLAVGDAEFQNKCIGKMQSVSQSGRTVLFVSHDLAAISALCSHAALLSRGKLSEFGEASDIIGIYLKSFRQVDASPEQQGSRAGIIDSVEVFDGRGRSEIVPLGGPLLVRVRFKCSSPLANPKIGIGIDNMHGQRVLTVHTPISQHCVTCIADGDCVECYLPSLPLVPGEYRVKVAITQLRDEIDSITDTAPFEVIDGNAFGEGRGFHRGLCVAPSEWSVKASRPGADHCG